MKSVLVISYYFPPMGMGGVQRTLKFVKYLPKFGWKPYVLTDTPRVYFARDALLLQELVGDNYPVFRTRSFGSRSLLTENKTFRLQSQRWRKFLSFLGQSFLIPDTKLLWKTKAISLGTEIIQNNPIHIIYATAPPYTDFLIGYHLSKRFNLPLVIDYRDLWVDCLNNVYPTPWHRKINSKLEAEVLSAASKVICINQRLKEMLLDKYPTISPDDIIVLSQGFDPADFANRNNGNPGQGQSFVPSAKERNYKSRFRLTYTGSFLYYYTPEYFLRALARVFYLHPELKHKIEACFAGTFPDEFIPLISELGLKDNVLITGYLNHPQCVDLMMNSDVLWMMINKTRVSCMHSTGKLYEYFGTRKPVLACVPDGVAKDSLKEYGAAKIAEPDNIEAIANSILEFYRMYQNNSLPVPDEKIVLKYDRERLTYQLSAIFDALSVISTKGGTF
jgi:glycosyltransferase involved in cell wall biosynthesis